MNVAKMAMSTKRQCRRYKCRHKGNVDVKHVNITDVDEPAMSTLRMSPLRQCRRKNVAIVEVAITNVGEPSFYPLVEHLLEIQVNPVQRRLIIVDNIIKK